MRPVRFRPFALLIATSSLLVGCAGILNSDPPPQRYRCEMGIEFSARFSGDSVTLDTTRGYELLFRDAPSSSAPAQPHEYRNPRMSAQFQVGKDGQEAVLRYPLLPLLVRCVKDQ